MAVCAATSKHRRARDIKKNLRQATQAGGSRSSKVGLKSTRQPPGLSPELWPVVAELDFAVHGLFCDTNSYPILNKRMVCGQRCSLCSRFLLFLFLSGGIALSIMCIWSCSFLDSGVIGARQSGVGLYRYVDDTGTCVVYSDDFPFTNSDQTARVCGLIAPIIAAGAGLLALIQLLCCNICCDRCFISCFFTSA